MLSYEELQQQAQFKDGWNISFNFPWDTSQASIQLLFESDTISEKINQDQYSTYEQLIQDEIKLKQRIVDKLIEYMHRIEEDIVPYISESQSIDDPQTVLKLNQLAIQNDGRLILFFDNAWDENGVAVIRTNDNQLQVGPQVIAWN